MAKYSSNGNLYEFENKISNFDKGKFYRKVKAQSHGPKARNYPGYGCRATEVRFVAYKAKLR